MPECNPSERTRRCIQGLAPQQRPCHPLHCSVVLCHDVVEVWDRADRDRGPLRLVVARDGGFLGVPAIKRERLGDAMVAAGLLEKPSCGLCVSMFGEEKVHGRAGLVDSARHWPLPLMDVSSMRQLTHTGRLRR
jgi:hypothetical protein